MQRNIQRRKFLVNVGAGVGASVAASTVLFPNLGAAQIAALPTIKWRLTSSFPKNLDTIFGSAVSLAKRVESATGGKFTIQVFAANELVPGPQALDAAKSGTVECAQSAPYYFFGKDSAFAFGTAIPFGMNARQQNAWMAHGGGLELMRDFYKDYNVINFPAGNTGAQMGGWFRKEIKTVEDLKGLKFRIAGFAGSILAKLGVVPQQIPGADIYPSLEKGTIDAAEWVGPYDDEKLGLDKIAKYYYTPGWWEGGAALDLFVNLQKWQALPPEYQSILQAACAEANGDMLAKYDALNPAAMRRLAKKGVELRPFSQEILEACYLATVEACEAEAIKNPKFKKIYEPWKQFRDEQILWSRVAEQKFDRFMAGANKILPVKKLL